MKFLLVGLGNPGAEYERTRHNIGFLALDALAKASGTSFAPDRLGDVARCKHRGRQLVLVKPATFMNLSGKSVRYWLDAEKISADRLMVVTDDINLPFGTLRIRAKGSDGGHNGLKDIQTLSRQQCLSPFEVWRRGRLWAWPPGGPCLGALFFGRGEGAGGAA